MAGISPTLEGFRAVWRRPSLTFAEISWRWMVGATGWALFLFSFLEYLRTLPVTNADLLLLRTRHPVLIGQAIGHILHGTLGRVLLAGLAGALAMAFLWVIVAATGRVVTLRALLDYFRRDVARKVSASKAPTPVDEHGVDTIREGGFLASGERDVASNVSANAAFRALAGLNFLRVALALASVTGFVGAAILAGFVSSPKNPRPALAFLLFIPMAGLVCLAWWILNWFLLLAGLFVVRDGEDTLGAVSSAVTFSRDRIGPVFAVSTWFALIHLALFIGATTVLSTPLGFAPIVPGRLLLATEIFLTLGYCVFADWLYMARLAGYACIAETPEALLAPPPPMPLYVPPSSGQQIEPGIPSQTSIDQSESILSDLPGLA